MSARRAVGAASDVACLASPEEAAAMAEVAAKGLVIAVLNKRCDGRAKNERHESPAGALGQPQSPQ